MEELRLCRQALSEPGSPSPRQVEGALLREALRRCPGASSWITRVPAGHQDRLALLREQGFQPLLLETLWYWDPDPIESGTAPPASTLPGGELQLRPLNRRSAPLLWHLEQATCPARLRQLLDRRIEDVLDQSEGHGLLWVDPSRQQAVAAVRRLRCRSLGPPELEVTLHPGWAHLYGPSLAGLVRQLAGGISPLRLRSDSDDHEREHWLSQLGAVAEGEELLMARSVWRRQGSRLLSRQSWRLDTVLDPFKPRRRPVPPPAARGGRPPCPPVSRHRAVSRQAPPPRSVLALDVGRRRIGLAGCDPLGLTVTPLPPWVGEHFQRISKGCAIWWRSGGSRPWWWVFPLMPTSSPPFRPSTAAATASAWPWPFACRWPG